MNNLLPSNAAFDEACGDVKASHANAVAKTLNHPTGFHSCSIYEVILRDDLPDFVPFNVRLTGTSRDNVKFEVEDETAGEIFEEDMRYAVQPMPPKIYDAVKAILKFYGINCGIPEELTIKDIAARCIGNVEGRYGNSVSNFSMFEADGVIMFSKSVQYNPIKGLSGG